MLCRKKNTTKISVLTEELIRVYEHLNEYIRSNSVALSHQSQHIAMQIAMFKSHFDLYENKDGTLNRKKIELALINGELDATTVRSEIEKIKPIINFHNIIREKLSPAYIKREFCEKVKSDFGIELKEPFFEYHNITAEWRTMPLTESDTTDEVMRRRVSKLFIDDKGNPLVITRQDTAADVARYRTTDQAKPQTIEEYIFGEDKAVGAFSHRLKQLDARDLKASGECVTRKLLARELKFFEECKQSSPLDSAKLLISTLPGQCCQELLNFIHTTANSIDAHAGVNTSNADDLKNYILSSYRSNLVYNIGPLCLVKTHSAINVWDEEKVNYVRGIYADVFNTPISSAAHTFQDDQIKSVISNEGVDILFNNFSFRAIFDQYKNNYSLLDEGIKDAICQSMTKQKIAYKDFLKIVNNPIIQDAIKSRFENYEGQKADFTQSLDQRFENFLSNEETDSKDDLQSWKDGQSELSLLEINRHIFELNFDSAYTVPELSIYGTGSIKHKFGSYWVSDILFPIYLNNEGIIKFI